MAVSIWHLSLASPSDIWKTYCQALEAQSAFVLYNSFNPDPMEQAEGLRYLTRLNRIALEMFLENGDPAFPGLYQASHATAKIGADNPDNFYQNATISGDQVYRISGHRGTVPIFSFATKANRYAINGTMASTGEIDIRDVECDADGNFEIIASKAKQERNWLPLEDDSSILIIRQTFFDKNTEIPAKVKLECISETGSPAPLTLSTLGTALEMVPAFIEGTAKTFLHWAEVFRENNFNALNTHDQSMFIRAGGDPMIYYLHGWWELGDREYLKITSEIPDCEGWNFELENMWLESLDYRHHKIWVNNQSAHYNEDGTVTVQVGGPEGHPNRLETCDHHRGAMLWRWTGANNHPTPKVEVLKH